MDPVDRVRAIVEPLLTTLDLELFDVELKAGVLRISVDRPEGAAEKGLDLDAISLASQRVSEALDAEDPIDGRYTLEVSSPGLERPLRTPAHFRRYVGTTVSVKTRPDVEGERRIEATLEAADDDGITVAGRRLSYEEIDRARTVFEWGGQPKPAKPAKQAKKHAKPDANKKAAS